MGRFGGFRRLNLYRSFGHDMVGRIRPHTGCFRIMRRFSLSLFAHAGKPFTDYKRDVYLNRTGVGLLFIYAQLREEVNNSVRFYF